MPVGFWIAVTVVCSAAAGATVMNIINKWPAAPDREGIELQSVDGLCSPTRLMRTDEGWRAVIDIEDPDREAQ